jgi:hypothetical protein
MFDNSNVSDKQIITPKERVEGCELVLMSRDKDPKSASFRSVTFHFKETATGAVLDHREFAPNRVIGTKTLTNDEYKKNISLTHSRIAHITRAFLPEEKFKLIKVEGDLDALLAAGNYAAIDAAWDAYITMTGQALGATGTGVEAAKGKAIALKVIYRTVKTKNYASLPNVPPFISSELHPKPFSTNPQYDKYTIEKVVPDTEQPSNSTGGGFGSGFAAPTEQPVAQPSGFGDAPTNHPSGF